VYSRLDIILNAETPSSWMNFGFWNEGVTNYAQAASALARTVGEASGLTENDCVLDLGFGCGDQLSVWLGLGADSIVGCTPELAQYEQARSRVSNMGSLSRCRLEMCAAGDILTQLCIQLDRNEDASDQPSRFESARPSAVSTVGPGAVGPPSEGSAVSDEWCQVSAASSSKSSWNEVNADERSSTSNGDSSSCSEGDHEADDNADDVDIQSPVASHRHICRYGPPFDRVVAVDSAYHWNFQQQCFRDCFRVLRPGGVFAFTDFVVPDDKPRPQSVLQCVKIAVCRGLLALTWSAMGIHSLPMKRHRSMLEGAGFSIKTYDCVSNQVLGGFARHVNRWASSELAKSFSLFNSLKVRLTAALLKWAFDLRLLQYVLVAAERPNRMQEYSAHV